VLSALSRRTSFQAGYNFPPLLCSTTEGAQNQVPKGIRYPGLPRFYSAQSPVGRYVLTAAIQHSLWKAVAESAFVPYGLQNCQEVAHAANTLYQKSRSHEAIWRVMTANAILENREALEILANRLRSIADRLLMSWEIFQEESQREEFRNRLSRLLYDHSKTWLSLLRLRNRMSVSLRWDGRSFEADSGEDLLKIPGKFTENDATDPILYLSPAFLEGDLDKKMKHPNLVQKGKVMFRNSPALLTALKEEQEINSPKLSKKKLRGPAD
jgi:hypothetical protein